MIEKHAFDLMDALDEYIDAKIEYAAARAANPEYASTHNLNGVRARLEDRIKELHALFRGLL